MKITGSRSSIKIEEDGKILNISGELTTTPTFYADISSMNYWETANGPVAITDGERKSLIARIVEEGRKNSFIIVFE